MANRAPRKIQGSIQIYPKPGWVEHDPELLWQTQVRTAHRVLAEHGVCGREVVEGGQLYIFTDGGLPE